MLKAYYQLSKYNKNNSLIRKTRKKKSRSFLHHFHQVLSPILGCAVTQTVHIHTTGNSFSPNNAGAQFKAADRGFGTDLGPDIAGIVVGTGNNPVDINDYDLTTRIAHGITSNTLEYFNCSVRALTINTGSNTGTFELYRFFRNSSGGSITITELGVLQTASYNPGSILISYGILTIRDLVSPGFQINDGEYMKITYTFQIVS